MSHAGRNYFDGLPNDNMEDILKSAIPEVILGEESDFIVPKDRTTKKLDEHHSLSMLFSDWSPFRTVVSSLFTRLILAGVGPTEISIERGMITIAPDVFMEIENGSVLQIFRKCGLSFTSITFFDSFLYYDVSKVDPISGTLLAQKLTSLLLTYCQNVDELIYDQSECTTMSWSTGGSVFQKLSSQLRSFDWNCRHFMSLPDLSACKNIRKANIRSEVVHDLIGKLHSIGNTLQELFIIGNISNHTCLQMIDAIQKHCPYLRKIQLDDEYLTPCEDWDNQYASFLCSYGTQLIEASPAKLSPKRFREVIGECTNLRFEYFEANYENVDEFKRLSIMGPRLDMLALVGYWHYGNEWSNALSQCSNLRRLRLDDFRMFASLTNCSMLKTLDMDNFDVTLETVSLVASKTMSLRQFIFCTKGLIEKGTIFKSLVNANRNLEYVSMMECIKYDEERSTEESLKIVGELVETFSNCREVLFNIPTTDENDVDEHAVREICGHFPCRGVSVSLRIGPEFEYQQTGKLT